MLRWERKGIDSTPKSSTTSPRSKKHILSGRKQGTVNATVDGAATSGVAVDPHSSEAATLETLADVTRAMHERVQLCQDLQTEFALIREMLGGQQSKPRTASARPHNPGRWRRSQDLR